MLLIQQTALANNLYKHKKCFIDVFFSVLEKIQDSHLIQMELTLEIQLLNVEECYSRPTLRLGQGQQWLVLQYYISILSASSKIL